MRALTEQAYSKLLIAVGTVLLLAGTMGAECHPIHYRDGNVLADSKSETLIYVSISPSDLSPQKLRCLANELKKRFHKSEDIMAMIFTSQDAAWHWRPIGVEPLPEDWVLQSYLHATYTYNRTRGQDYIELFPIYQISDIETKYDRGSTGPINCQAQVAHRCLVSLQEPDYPANAFRSGKSGVVMLAGTITKGGKVENVTVENTDDTSGILRENALKNLKTWKFEQAQRSAPIRIKYSYVFDQQETENKRLRVKFKLPEEVVITASPMR